jgi:uncharacterized phage-associated protein
MKLVNLEALLAEIAHLTKAKELLEKVYSEYGAYGDGQISDQTRYEMQKFFKFDDSE